MILWAIWVAISVETETVAACTSDISVVRRERYPKPSFGPAPKLNSLSAAVNPDEGCNPHAFPFEHPVY
jgi:hypothetical protein